jgi:iron complex outermembrane recepter protein
MTSSTSAARRFTAAFALRPLPKALAMVIGAGSLLVGAGAQAQSSSATAAADTGQLQTVSVTANRRIEDQQKVSTSVTALSGEMLSTRNVVDISQFEGLAPGFTFGRSGTDARPAMRGVRTEAIQQNADTTIGYFVDGIYKSRAAQALASFVDLERVEVQRGPQGTLFGRNTFGGNIVVTTMEPQLDGVEGSASLLLGSYKRARLELVGNAPISKSLALRVAAAGEKADGWVENDYNPAADLFDQDLKFLRLSALYKPDDRFKAVMRLSGTAQDGNGAGGFSYFQRGTYVNSTCRTLLNATFLPLNGRGGLVDGVPDCTRTEGVPGGPGIGTTADLGRPVYSPNNVYRVENDFQTYLKVRDTSFSADVSYRFDNFSLKSITGFSDFSFLRTIDQDFSRESIALSFEGTKSKSASQEFQILSEGKGPFGYVAGVYIFKDKIDALGVFQSLRRSVGNGSADTAVAETDSKAVYGQLSYKATSALTLTGGLRYTVDKKKYKFANRNSVVAPSPNLNDPDPKFNDSPYELVAQDPAFGSAGTSNCGTAVGGFPAGIVVPGANCGGPGNNTFFGATFTPVEFKRTTGRAAVEYQLNKDQMVYLSYSTGFTSGGFNSSQVALLSERTRTFDPQEVEAVEIGSKNRFLDNTLQLNIAAFQNRYTDLQEQRQVAVGLTTATLLFNAARAKATGLEIEGQWRATRQFTLGGTLSLLDAKYTSFPDAPGPIAITQLVDAPGAPATVVDGVTIAPAGQKRVFAPGFKCRLVPGTGVGGVPQAYGCDLTGNRIPYAAKQSGSVFASYDIPVGMGTITPMLSVTFSSGYHGQIYNTDAEKQGSYWKGDARVNWKINDRLAVQAFVDNFNNETVINRVTWGGGATLQASAAPPRTYGMKVSYSFY